VPRDIVNFTQPTISDPEYLRAAQSLKMAFDKNPDTVICVSDYGLPVTDAELNLDSYFCNRWAGSINGDESVFIWGLVALGLAPKEDLEGIRDSLTGKTVILIRLANESHSDSYELSVSETWWSEYVDPSWEIINTD
jgi:hypothetical protein